eukprot:5106898-Pyramimonas_sp.AAC.1
MLAALGVAVVGVPNLAMRPLGRDHLVGDAVGHDELRELADGVVRRVDPRVIGCPRWHLHLHVGAGDVADRGQFDINNHGRPLSLGLDLQL